jgi:hypothetical protein
MALEEKLIRAGREMCVSGAISWLVRSGRGFPTKLMRIISSFVHVDRAVIIDSGEKYPESGIFSNIRWTRSLVDKRSRGASGNGIPLSQNFLRHGADPPKNSLRRTGAVSSPAQSRTYSSVGYVSCICIANFSKRELGRSSRSMWYTSSRRSSAAMT